MSLQSSVAHSPPKANDRPTLSIDEIMSEDEARRRREQLNRRPSYRMILKDLETLGDKPLKKEIDDSLTERPNNNLLGPPTSVVHFEVPTTTHLPDRPPLDRAPPVPTMRNQNDADPVLTARLNAANNRADGIPSQPPPQIHGGSQQPLLSVPGTNGTLVLPVSSDLLSLKPVNDQISLSTSVANFPHTNDWHPMNGMPTKIEPYGCPISVAITPSLDWQTGLLSQYGAGHSPLAGATRQGSASLTSLSDNDESNRKRQVRLLKNREAAKECRRKKKEYVKCLENRVAVLENQNKALIEELKALKEMYCRKEKEM